MNQQHTELAVAGMTCPSCTRHISSALTKVAGISDVEVRLKTGTVIVRHDPDASLPKMLEALQDAGYSARPRAAV